MEAGCGVLEGCERVGGGFELGFGTADEDDLSDFGFSEGLGDGRANSVAATCDQDGFARELLF